MLESVPPTLITFSPRHRRYLASVLREIVDYYGEGLQGCAVFGSYARGDNLLNSDFDLLIILNRFRASAAASRSLWRTSK